MCSHRKGTKQVLSGLDVLTAALLLAGTVLIVLGTVLCVPDDRVVLDDTVEVDKPVLVVVVTVLSVDIMLETDVAVVDGVVVTVDVDELVVDDVALVVALVDVVLIWQSSSMYCATT